ncbi:MAG: PhnD/SsuA/transferrin family substrate-binding protein [Pleurocapsa minor GSE-CHR-MK-17-07R]|jgi:phosphonate transport system substrate-binding protein|nr:PhnD/SsuA/transferrin family substrate-binding protein [Pleurocapsa minor GSE-CHR-MK 17-07R]
MPAYDAFTYLAPVQFALYQGMLNAITRASGPALALHAREADPLDELVAVQAVPPMLAFICGLPMVRHNAAGREPLLPVVAPVYAHPRYENRAEYFADVIVRRDSAYQSLADLQGATFAFNDVGSNSGHHMLRHALWVSGAPAPFFGRTLPSGAHSQSVRLVASGQVDCAAIDSTVLEQMLRAEPTLTSQIRVVHSVGPYPVPPLAILSRYATRLEQFQAILSQPDAALSQLLGEYGIARLEPVSLREYESIWLMYSTVEQAGYQILDL